MTVDNRFNPDELKQLLQNKYGTGVRVQVFPNAQGEETDEVEGEELHTTQKFDFEHKPSGIKEYLDRYVIQQDDAKKVLATAICDHYHHIQNCQGSEDCRDYKKQNIILIGPSGVGKTYLVQNVARLIGVPFFKADATKYSETGYVGGDVEDLIRELVHQAKGDIQLAEYGIVYLDEIDKIASPSNSLGRDVSGHGVQRGLLKLLEETEVPLKSPTDIASQMQAFMEVQAGGKPEKKTINTKHILFIVSGAFTGLTDIIRKRLGAKRIGFIGEKTSQEQQRFLLQKARSVDFIDYGFESEFIGRLPVVVHCNPLTVPDLFRILKDSEGSLLKQYKSDFLAYGIDAYFKDEGIRAIAERAALEETGARGLITVCEQLFREYKYQLPDSEVGDLVVGREMVKDPPGKLAELLANPNLYREEVLGFRLKKLEREFSDNFGVEIRFTPEAAELLASRAVAEGRDILEYCRELFRDYEHGVKLLKKSSRKEPWVFDVDAVSDPSGSLERWIRETYH